MSEYVFNPMEGLYRTSPAQALMELREHSGPFHWSPRPAPAKPLLLVLGHAEVNDLLRDPRLARSMPPSPGQPMPPPNPLQILMSRWMLANDGARHAHLRSPFVTAFSKREIGQLGPHIQDIAHGLLDVGMQQGGFDLLRDYAFLLPTTVVAELVGMPGKDKALLSEWAPLIFEIGNLIPPTQERWKEIFDVSAQMITYFGDLTERLKSKPGADIISDVIRENVVAMAADKLTDEEIAAQAAQLFIAGHETVQNFIANAVLDLLYHPQQLDLYRRNRAIRGQAFEELARRNPPISGVNRIAIEEIKIGGYTIEAGQPLALMLMAANYDETVFAHPLEMDFARSNLNKHIGFGAGIHYCLGAPLARLEGQVAISALVDRADLYLRDGYTPERREALIINGLKSLMVNLVPRS